MIGLCTTTGSLELQLVDHFVTTSKTSAHFVSLLNKRAVPQVSLPDGALVNEREVK